MSSVKKKMKYNPNPLQTKDNTERGGLPVSVISVSMFRNIAFHFQVSFKGGFVL